MLWVHTKGGRPANGLEGISQMWNLEIEEILRSDQDDQTYETTAVQGINKQGITLILEKEATGARFDKYL